MRGRRSARAVAAAMVLLVGCAGGDDDVGGGVATETSAATTAAPPPGLVRVVVDTDLAMDDLMALAFLLSSPGVDVEAVTVTGAGEVRCPPGVEIAQGLFALVGHEDVPVACGRATPLAGSREFPAEWREAADSAYGVELPAPATPLPDDAPTAVDLLREHLGQGGVTLLTLGPLTNVAEAFRVEPGLAGDVGSVVVMGGAIDANGNVFGDDVTTPVAEWNVYVDPTAAAEVVASGAPVVLVGLDATNEVPITPSFLETMEANAHEPAAVLVHRLLSENPFVVSGESFFWDPLAAAAVVEPGLLTTDITGIEVVTAEGPDIGRTVRSAAGAPVAVATDVDADAFYEVLVRALDGLADDEPLASLPPPVGEAAVRFDGTVCAYEGPATVPAGRMVVRFESTVRLAGAAVVHLVGDATIEDALAWVDANPASEVMPPMVDQVDDVGPGETATVTVQEGHEAVVCGSEGSLVVATSLIVTP